MDAVLLLLAILVSLPMLFMAGELALALIARRRVEPLVPIGAVPQS